MPTHRLVDMRALQAPLRARYRAHPEQANILDRAVIRSANLRDPFHSSVRLGSHSAADFAFGVHAAIGGPHDLPVPGDLLCAALAACLESCLRIVANFMQIELEALDIEVEGDVDVRGTLGTERDVPVGFTAIRAQVNLRAAPGTRQDRLRHLALAAERACVILDTLRRGVPVSCKISQR